MQGRLPSLLVAALLALGACSSGSAVDDDAQSLTTTPPADESVAPEVPEQPRPGTYVYELLGQRGTDVPEGSLLTEELSASGNDYSVLITNNQNSNTRTIRLRWEEERVVQLSNQTTVGGDRRTCNFEPPLETLHIPIRIEEFSEQATGGPGCNQTVAISVVGRQEIQDATGRTWSTWIIEMQSLSGGRTDEETRWFSPELGRDVRIDTATETDTRRSETTQLLSSFPSG